MYDSLKCFEPTLIVCEDREGINKRIIIKRTVREILGLIGKRFPAAPGMTDLLFKILSIN
jgi:hypothetical protein